jgi:Recombinase
MHQDAKRVRIRVRCTVSHRRQQRRAEKERRHAPPPTIVREATRVERLAYTRTQAAEALGISRSTFNRRVLSYVDTVETPWGGQLIPADELERLLAEWRRAPRKPRAPQAPPGRPSVVPQEIVERIRAERAAGRSLAQIARDLNASRTPTAHGGERWWPSTVRSVVSRSSAPG